MKTLLLLGLCCLCITACRKNPAADNASITGRWELRKATGGVVAQIVYEPGNGQLLLFNSVNEYTRMNAGAVIQTGRYELEKLRGADSFQLRLQYRINTGMQISDSNLVRLTANELIFLPKETCCDMQTIFYERVLP